VRDERVVTDDKPPDLGPDWGEIEPHERERFRR
jgi:hypothetical protein